MEPLIDRIRLPLPKISWLSSSASLNRPMEYSMSLGVLSLSEPTIPSPVPIPSRNVEMSWRVFGENIRYSVNRPKQRCYNDNLDTERETPHYSASTCITRDCLFSWRSKSKKMSDLISMLPSIVVKSSSQLPQTTTNRCQSWSFKRRDRALGRRLLSQHTITWPVDFHLNLR